jgi:hypothetical protein
MIAEGWIMCFYYLEKMSSVDIKTLIFSVLRFLVFKKHIIDLTFV